LRQALADIHRATAGSAVPPQPWHWGFELEKLDQQALEAGWDRNDAFDLHGPLACVCFERHTSEVVLWRLGWECFLSDPVIRWAARLACYELARAFGNAPDELKVIYIPNDACGLVYQPRSLDEVQQALWRAFGPPSPSVEVIYREDESRCVAYDGYYVDRFADMVAV
jgi:hypothetical protein